MTRYLALVLVLISPIISTIAVSSSWGGLYPKESESRELKSLDGLWDFRLSPMDDPDKGFREEWYKQPMRYNGSWVTMPVPSSYNEVMTEKVLRDHVGWAWYEKQFYVPARWASDHQRVVLRFGSAHYYAIVYLNGVELMTHEGGHLPFMAVVSDAVNYGSSNRLTVALNNTLSPETIPQGKIEYMDDEDLYPPGYFVQTYTFDFFNFAGIHRSVLLYTTPQTYIDDISIITTLNGATGLISYNVSYASMDTNYSGGPLECLLQLFDKSGHQAATATECEGTIEVENANLWWPFLMALERGYMYDLVISLVDNDTMSGTVDKYTQKVGIREIGWNDTDVTINGRKLYLRGCGKHEDSHIHGKGADLPLFIKDFSLLLWLGANSFRTSHYPYAEEIMDLADQEGMMVIDEISAVNLEGFGEALLEKHKTIERELVMRDKNRPSVIMWSVGNEPRSNQEAAGPYFQNITDFTRSLDSTRPVTCALSRPLSDDLAPPSLDVIMINRYFSWYHDTGHLELIQRQTLNEFRAWYEAYHKPIMISEYGAGTIAGLHAEPAFVWSEEYQGELLEQNFKAFDTLKDEGYFFGEHIWNFADFATVQGTTRVGGNKKGIFTRARQPKASAHLLRQRYHALAEADNSTSQRLGHLYHKSEL